MDSKRPDTAPDEAGRTAKRTPRTIRFLDPEWRRIEAFADRRGLTGPEFVRFAALAAMEEAPAAPDSCDRLAPLIERTFRYAHVLASAMRGRMLDGGREKELEELVAAARALQDELLGDGPTE